MPTIALVDDDRNILTSVSMALESEGYRIMTYTDGASALDGFRTSPPDLAVLDIKMPRMDGMETLRRLRQKSDLPVIFLTSKDEEIDELFGLKMGADDFIRKPFSQRLLVERVKAVLRRSAPKDPTAVPKENDAKALDRGLLRMSRRSALGMCAFIQATHSPYCQSALVQIPMKPLRIASSTVISPDDHSSYGVNGVG